MELSFDALYNMYLANDKTTKYIQDTTILPIRHTIMLHATNDDVYTFPKSNHDAIDSYGYTNVKIEGNFNEMDINNIKFRVGGSNIINYPTKHENYLSFTLFEDTVIPKLFYHEYQISINHKCDVKITYDEVKIINPTVNQNEIKNCIIQWNHMICFDKYDIGHNKIKLNLDKLTRETKKICIKANKNVTNMKLIIDDKYFAFGHTDDSNYECNFGELISLCCAKLYLEFDCQGSAQNNPIEIYVYAYNVLRFVQGIAGGIAGLAIPS